jgi:hypothetical protein
MCLRVKNVSERVAENQNIIFIINVFFPEVVPLIMWKYMVQQFIPQTEI